MTHLDLSPYFDVGVLEARPKLLFDVQYQRHDDGIRFRRRKSSFSVDGEDTFRVMLELAQYLTGEATVAEICAQLSPVDVDTAITLIQALQAYDCLIDRKVEETELPDDVRQRFAAQIEFIGQFTADPLHRFERFRTSRVLVLGCGDAARSVIASLARNGIRSLLCDQQVLASRAIDELVLECRAINPQFELESVDIATALPPGGTCKRVDVLCYASETPDLAAVTNLCLECARRKIAFIPAVLMTGKGFVGPLFSGPGAPCWLCFLLRRCERIDPQHSTSIWRALALKTQLQEETRADGRRTAQIVANLAAFEAFKYLVGHLPCEIEGNVLCVDVESLELHECRLLPHPLCACCSSMTDDSDQRHFAAAEPMHGSASPSLLQRLQRTSVLVDAEVGIIGKFDDDEVSQSPLFQAVAIVRQQPAGTVRSVTGFSLYSYAEAKLDAVNSVLRDYGAGQFDRRRVWTGSAIDAQQKGHRVIALATLPGALLPAGDSQHECLDWTFAASLTTKEICLLPTAAVYRRSPVNTGLFERIDAGVGIGSSFDAACNDAIRSSAVYGCLRSLAAGQLAPFKPRLGPLRQSSADLELALVVCEQQRIPLRVLCASYQDFNVAIAFSTALPLEGTNIAVAADKRVAAAVTAALTDLVAITNAGLVSRPLNYYLPPELGYCLEPDRLERHSREVDIVGATSELVSSRDAVEVIIANMSTGDIQAAGFTLVRAFLTTSRG